MTTLDAPMTAAEGGDGRDHDEVDAERLHRAVDGFADRFPDYSARRTFLLRQRIGIGVALVAVAVLFWRFPVPTGTAMMGAAVFTYTSMLAFRIWLMLRNRGDHDPTFVIDDDAARALPDDALPTFSILVPAYREPEVLPFVIEQLSAFEYPKDKYQVLLVLEADDDLTLGALATVELPSNFSVVAVPPADPRTKPKACNYALDECTGEIVTIYDAEDRPEPLQLRRVASAFAKAPENVGCIQAELAFFNADENLVTRWFTVDYRVWFTQYLPGLAATETPIPLGGTSNHIRKDLLIAIGAWDPYNVTEDADLGIRLHRQGFRVGIVDSITYEEANVDVVNWVKQRSRWYKGYLQTWLVHVRRPVRLFKDLGLGQFLRFNLFVAGTPLLAALNPVSWAIIVIWFGFQPAYILAITPPPVYYPGLLTWVVGNFVFYYLNMAAAHDAGGRRIVRAAALLPLYWLMMALAAAKALVQLIVDPNYWEKTAHGLSGQTNAAPTQEAPLLPIEALDGGHVA